MLKRSTKDLFYTMCSPLMRANALIYKAVRSPRGEGGAKVHLGPGQKNYLPGWINVDANTFTAKCDVWTDLRFRLPFRDSTLQAVYSHHVIEHLPDLEAHVQDVYRCLRSGGVYRVGGPNGDSAIQKFTTNDRSWFGDWPDRRESIGGRLENFVFCRGEHLTILTYSYLEELLTRAGFVDVRRCLPTRETAYPSLFNACLGIEHENDFDCPHTLIVEARKPMAH